MPRGKSDYLEAAQLNGRYGGPAFALPATIHVALFSAGPNDAGTGTELTGGGYARVGVTNNTTNWPAGNPKSNGVAISFPQATADWVRAFNFATYDAATAGNLLDYGPLMSAIKLGSLDATDVTNNTITSIAHGLTNGTVVRVLSFAGGALPGGLAEDTRYFVVGATADTFQLSATSGGVAIDITSAGSGFVEFGTDQSIVVTSGGTASFAVGQLQILED